MGGVGEWVGGWVVSGEWVGGWVVVVVGGWVGE